MKLRIKGILVLSVLSVFMLSCGFSFKNKPVTLNTESWILYQNCSVEQIISEMKKDVDSAKDKYDDGYYIVLGKITEIAENNKTIVLSDMKGTNQETVKCSVADNAVITEIKAHKINDAVKVYGKVKLSGSRGKAKMDIVKMESADGTVSVDTKYSYIDGKTYDTAAMLEQQLHNGKVKYYVPMEWKAVENSIVPDFGNMEGYQYVLNALADEPAAEPESLFVCYFDSKNQLKDRSQVNETKAIRELIVSNILGDDYIKGKIQKKKTYYGTTYYYYVGDYLDQQAVRHRVEFVFQDIENEGMIVYLYVYEQEKHVEDIMCVMRCLRL